MLLKIEVLLPAHLQIPVYLYLHEKSEDLM
jgi:hypothetical protein